ncbi:MAG: hypothetical protein AAF192_01105 [Pseudomonadota bacterium]
MTLSVANIEGSVQADAGGFVALGTLAPTGGTAPYRFIAVGQAFLDAGGSVAASAEVSGAADHQQAGPAASDAGRIAATSSAAGRAGRVRRAGGGVAASSDLQAPAVRRRGASGAVVQISSASAAVRRLRRAGGDIAATVSAAAAVGRRRVAGGLVAAALAAVGMPSRTLRAAGAAWAVAASQARAQLLGVADAPPDPPAHELVLARRRPAAPLVRQRPTLKLRRSA